VPLVQLDARIAQAEYDAALAKLRVAQERNQRTQYLESKQLAAKQALDDTMVAVETAQADADVRKTQVGLLTIRRRSAASSASSCSPSANT